MKHNWFVIFLIILMVSGAACGDQNTEEEDIESSPPSETTAVTSSQGMGTFFSINEVGLGDNGYVALTNFTDVPASLQGLYLCQGSACFPLPDTTIDPGETVRIAAGDGDGYENVVAANATFGTLTPSNGEIALFESQEIDNPQNMRVYFQWGSTPHELTQVALDAGLWVEGGYGPSSENATRLYKVEETGLWLFEE